MKMSHRRRRAMTRLSTSLNALKKARAFSWPADRLSAARRNIPFITAGCRRYGKKEQREQWQSYSPRCRDCRFEHTRRGDIGANKRAREPARVGWRIWNIGSPYCWNVLHFYFHDGASHGRARRDFTSARNIRHRPNRSSWLRNRGFSDIQIRER